VVQRFVDALTHLEPHAGIPDNPTLDPGLTPRSED